jgi:leucyl aminopeptidase
LHGRVKPKADSVRVATASNTKQTLCVLAYTKDDASAFELQALAARALKEVASRTPRIVAVEALHSGRMQGAARSALWSAALAACHTMPNFQSERRKAPTPEVLLIGAAADVKPVAAAAKANNLVRWLTALPPNRLDARGYRRTIQQLVRTSGLKTRWYDEASLRRLGAGAFLAVAAGNANADAGILQIQYRPRARRRGVDLALVGKGILFDTGGNNLKPHRNMLDMHIDMSGSAVALATLLALVEQRVPLNVDCWLAITENRIGPTAYRPQDVVRACNGVTIQVIHTDAEGRMVLADTLALAGRARPRLILDFATLTGAAIYALTERMGAVLTNREHLHPLLVAAGRSSGERVWPFPLDGDFDSDIESKVADVQQCSADGKGDQILAARFLQRFVPQNSAWVHLDLAPALRHGGLGAIPTDITGFGARYALELLLTHRVLDKLNTGPN